MHILYGRIIWYTKKNNNTVTQLPNTWKHKATCVRTGMMRQPPIAFLKQYGNVPCFTKQLIQLTLNYIHNKLTGPTEDPTAEMICGEHPLTPPSHPSPLKLIINKEDLLKSHQKRCETILTLPNPPWAQPIASINNTTLTKEQAKRILPNQVRE
ncbi:hypothetical protein O181_024558 [Austropuccinia psidii MF-1]|uniref:Uncharacterized protein n=1 Tax=Austropuccinia psidii MF-1 TaxID=1389203 RepID=A0A9Q3CL08_9BASI|nr:hypothetical protein [Austropuccinia psidii MF-1]